MPRAKEDANQSQDNQEVLYIPHNNKDQCSPSYYFNTYHLFFLLKMMMMLLLLLQLVRNQNKTGALATLTQDHFDLICNPHGWLDCDIIQQANIVLYNENLNIEGFQRPTLGPVRNFDIVSGELCLGNL